MEADQDAQKAQELAEAEEQERHKGKIGFRSGFKKMLGRD